MNSNFPAFILLLAHFLEVLFIAPETITNLRKEYTTTWLVGEEVALSSLFFCLDFFPLMIILNRP